MFKRVDKKISEYSLPRLVPVAVRGALLSLPIFTLREVRNISDHKQTTGYVKYDDLKVACGVVNH